MQRNTSQEIETTNFIGSIENVYTTPGIVIKDLCRSFGRAKVLNHLNMNVQRGHIYALLGPSGCGKTTLLRLILGRLRPDSGEILVLGKPPYSKGHAIPGRAVGYAPQEIALFDDLSIKETFDFFASMYCMSPSEYKRRKRYLLEMLDLPREAKIVRNLSGGQKRRVSLAMALLHDPELLILDEPTVGVDPLLRARIWHYLKDISRKFGVTIVITTHYIEEARGADCVGLMRHGRLLAEDNPDVLLERYRCNTLEEVFLYLCRSEKFAVDTRGELSTKNEPLTMVIEHQNTRQESNHNASTNNNDDSSRQTQSSIRVSDLSLNIGSSTNIMMKDSHLNINENITDEANEPLLGKEKKRQPSIGWRRHPKQILAISKRNIIQLLRNWKLLLFDILFPTIQIFLFVIAIGSDPHGLPVTVVNLDQGLKFPPMNFAQMYLNQLSNNHRDIIRLKNASTLDEGIESVRNGSSWCALYFPKNYSTALMQQMQKPLDTSLRNDSTIHVYFDMSNYQITLSILNALQNAFEGLSEQLLHTSLNPVQIEPPIYGTLSTKFMNFLAPGMITAITFAHAIGITALAFVREKMDGSLDRVFAGGVRSASIICGHFLTHSLVLIIQTTLLLVVAVFFFKVPVEGSLVYLFSLTLLLGFVGMSYGLVISSVCNSERDAVQLALASFFPLLLLSGIIWPVEAIPRWFSWFSLAMPTTWAANAMRSVMIRGWGISWPQVWMSYTVAGAWAIFFIFVASVNLSERETRWWHRCSRMCSSGTRK
jgi:ABC-type multidrug transport system ATPase subunit/ABC-type multidrug transport system permease subunit